MKKELPRSVKVLVVMSTIALSGIALGGHEFLFGAASIAVLMTLVASAKYRTKTQRLLKTVFASSK